MTSNFEVKPTSLIATAPKASLSGESASRIEHSERRGLKQAICPREWAEGAWTAIERALARCPYPLGCMKTHSPDHPTWVKDREEFVSLYTERLKEGSAIKWLKFHTSYCFAYAYNQSELPPAPGAFVENEKPGRFIGKTLGKALQTVMARGKSGNWPARRCALDILMSKIGDPPATEEFVKGSMKDHRTALTQPHPGLSESAEERRTQVLQMIDSIVGTVFKGVKFSHRDLVPSLRASFERGLADGGALGDLFGKMGLGTETTIRVPVLRAMFYSPQQGVMSLYLPDVQDLVSDFQDLVDGEWFERISEPLRAIPSPILEPLKVRVITKGQSAEYYRSLELQRLMHRTLISCPIFEFIGRPIDNEAFGRAFGCPDDLCEDEFYVSGDYKAATDNLDPTLSEYAWRAICRNVQIWYEGSYVTLEETPYCDLGVKALTRHMLYYARDPAPSREEKQACSDSEELNRLLYEACPQVWGQLMGSPMSFPILCIVNAAASLSVVRRWGLHPLDEVLIRDYSFADWLAEVPLRVNGDDIGFIANEEVYEDWKTVTAECGLQFSLGKNYTSREFLLMNSELRRPPSQRWEVSSKPSPYMTETRAVFPRPHVQELKFLDDEEAFWGCFLEKQENDWSESTILRRSILLESSPLPRMEWEHPDRFYRHPASWKLEGFLNQSLMYHTVRKGMEAGQQKDVYWTDLADLSRQVLVGIPGKDQKKFLDLFLHSHDSVLREIPPLANLWIPRALGGVGVQLPKGTDLQTSIEGGRDSALVQKQLKVAAYFACNPAKRLKAVRTPSGPRSFTDEVFKDLRTCSDDQVPPVLRRAEPGMFPGQKPALEGTSLLGMALDRMDLYMAHGCGGDDTLVSGELKPERKTDACHRSLNTLLNQRYRNWTRGALTHSLTPMSFDGLSKFAETHVLISRIETIHESPSVRSLDVAWADSPLVGLLAAEVGL